LLPLPDSTKASANKAESLWLETGFGYKTVLTELEKQLIRFGTKKIQRSLFIELYTQCQLIKQSIIILMPRGTYSAARILSVQAEGKINKIMLSKLVACTHLIERIPYKIVSERLI
jgi:hypothetical protein